MELTKNESVEKTRTMYQWLSEHPDKSKADYFTENKIYDIPDSHCYLCEYTVAAGDNDKILGCCGNCPFLGRWVNGEKGSTCGNENSPYYKWMNAETLKEDIKYLLEIVALCDEFLLENKEDCFGKR